MPFYSVAGLVITSEVPLAGLTALPGAFKADAGVRLGHVPDQISAPTRIGPNWALNETELLLSIPGLASFLLSGGREIRFAPAPGRRAEDAAPFLAQNLLALLMQQRGLIVLRASSIEIDGQALLFCGDGAAGKSTFAAAMTNAGHRPLGDDFCTVEMGADGAFHVRGDGADSMLWADAIHALDLSQAAPVAIREGIEKYCVPGPRSIAGRRPLGAIYSLREDGLTDVARLEALRGMAAVQAARDSTYRPLALGSAERKLLYFQTATRIVTRAPVFGLTRGSGFDWIDEGIGLVEASRAEAAAEE